MTRPFLLASLATLVLSIAAPRPSDSTPQSKLAPVGTEFQVNTYTTDAQYDPVVTAHDGGFVVVWTTLGAFADPDVSIQARRYDAEGLALGDQFQVNTYTYTTGFQNRPGVASWPDGRFVVVWDEFIGASNTPRIRGRLFSADGVPQYEEFSLDEQAFPPLAVEVVDDAVLLVWAGDGDVDRDILGQLYDTSGSPVGTQFLVNSLTTGFQNAPSVRAAPDGSFRVVWWSETSTGDDPSFSIQTRRVAADGTPQGSDFQVNSYTTGYSYGPSIDFAPDGRFVVAFQNYGGSPGDDTIYGSLAARRFDSAGAPVGDDFQVNSYTDGFAYYPRVKVGRQGDFVIVWSGPTTGATGPTDYSAVVDRFDSAGNRIGAEFIANTLTTGEQYGPTIAMRDSGDFLVVWDSEVSPGDDDELRSIQARLYRTEADVSVTKTDGVDVATPGGTVTYAIDVAHTGPDAATSVSLTDVLPADLDCTFTSVASGGATGNTAAGAGDLDETLFLPTGAGVSYTLECDVVPDARGELVNQAAVVTDQVDANPANDQATDTDTLEPSTDLSVELMLTDLKAIPGEIETVRATIANQGPSSSFGSILAGALPSEVSFVSSSDCTVGAGVVLCSVPALGPGEQTTVEYQLLVDSMVPLGTEIVVDVTVTTSDLDPNPSDDSDSATLTVVAAEIFADGFESGDVSAWSSAAP